MCTLRTFLSRALLTGAFIATTSLSYGQQADTQRWVNQLKQGTSAEKCEAADQISAEGISSDALKWALLAGLKDSDASVRWHTARAVARTRTDAPAIANELTRMLGSESPVVRIHAARAIAAIGHKDDAAIRGLVNMVTDTDGRVARIAIAVLRELKPDRKFAAEALAEVLDHEEQAVAIYAVEAMVEGGADSVPFLTEALKAERSGYWAVVAIEQIGPAAAETLPGIIRLIENTSDSQVRMQGLLALAALGPAAEGACETVSNLLKTEQDTAARAASVYALGSIGCVDSVPALNDAANDENALVSMIATWALAMVQPEDKQAQQRAVAKLIAGLKSNESRIRVVAAKGLNRLDAPPEMVAPELIAAAKDPDPSVLANVLDALASLGAPVLKRAVPALQKPEVRDIAVAVISRLGSEGAAAAPGLLAAVDTNDPEFTAQIHHALGEIGAATPAVLEELKSSLASQNGPIRQSAILALGNLGPKAAAVSDSLRELIGTANSFDQIAAAWALVQIHPNDGEVATLCFPHLLAGLKSNEAIVRVESANALGAMGASAKDALETLMALAENDANPAVREAAENAVNAIK